MMVPSGYLARLTPQLLLGPAHRGQMRRISRQACLALLIAGACAKIHAEHVLPRSDPGRRRNPVKSIGRRNDALNRLGRSLRLPPVMPDDDRYRLVILFPPPHPLAHAPAAIGPERFLREPLHTRGRDAYGGTHLIALIDLTERRQQRHVHGPLFEMPRPGLL